MDTDAVIVDKVRAGDINSFEALVTAYQNKIYAFIYRMVMSAEDARDLTQEVFFQAFRSLDSFRGEAKFTTWLYRIAANKTMDFLRRTKSSGRPDITVERAGDKPAAACPSGGNPEHVVLRNEKIHRLRNLISGLPDRYRVTLVMFHFENLTYQQIADVLGVPVKTVATRLYRAKLILRENLGGEADGMP